MAGNWGRVEAALERHATELAEFLSNTVAIPSVSGSEEELAEWYEAWMRRAGWTVRRQVVSDADQGRGRNLVGTVGAGEPSVVVNGHMDVVPVRDDEVWTAGPFSGAVIGAEVHGRGSVDTKGGIAAALYAQLALMEAGEAVVRAIRTDLVVEEETTGIGSRASAGLAGRVPSAAIVLEPTRGAIAAAGCGVLFFTVEVEGRSAHTSMPWEGVNALAKLDLVYHGLLDLAKERSARHRHPLFNDVLDPLPFVVGTFTAGKFRASVPDRAFMSGRIGVAPGESLNDVRAEWESRVRELSAEDPWLSDHPARILWQGGAGLPWETSVKHPLVTSFKGAQERITGSAAVTGLTAGCDAGYYAERGIPTIVFGPGNLARAHSPNESIDIAEVVVAAKTIALGLLRLGRKLVARSG